MTSFSIVKMHETDKRVIIPSYGDNNTCKFDENRLESEREVAATRSDQTARL